MNPYAPGPQGDDKPGCFDTMLRMAVAVLLLGLLLLGYTWADGGGK